MLSRSSKVQAGITFQYLRMPRCCGRSHVLPCPAKVPFPRLLIGAQSASHQAYRIPGHPPLCSFPDIQGGETFSLASLALPLRWIEHVKLLGAAHPRTTLMSSVALSTACPHFVLDF